MIYAIPWFSILIRQHRTKCKLAQGIMKKQNELVIRKLDELGRIVLPVEVRRAFFREIILQNGKVMI